MITGEPYPIKGLVTYAVNLFHSLPNPARTRRACVLRDRDDARRHVAV